MNGPIREVNKDFYFSVTDSVFVVGQESDPDILAAVVGAKNENIQVSQGLGATGIKLMRKNLQDGSAMYVATSTNKLHAHDLDVTRGAIAEDLSPRQKKFLESWYAMRGVTSQAIVRPYSILDLYNEDFLAVVPMISDTPVTVDMSGEFIDDPEIDQQNYNPHAFTPKEVVLAQAQRFRETLE